MTYDILATGSSGNAVVINGEILIDIGVSMKKLRESGYIKSLKLVLLTHEHGDHFNAATVRALHKERPALRFACCDWMVTKLMDAGVKSRKIDVTGYIGVGLLYAGLGEVEPVPLIHDVPNCAWRIRFENGERLFYATDTGTLDYIEAKDYDLYLVESNRTDAEFSAAIAEKQARGEFAYETRAAANHLSQERALDFLARNAGPNSRYAFLHQHKSRRTAIGNTHGNQEILKTGWEKHG